MVASHFLKMWLRTLFVPPLLEVPTRHELLHMENPMLSGLPQVPVDKQRERLTNELNRQFSSETFCATRFAL
jgi:hypothetical protein